MAASDAVGINFVLIFALINYILLLKNQSVTAELITSPMWNIASHGNGSEPCSLRLDHANENVSVFTGDQFEICTVQVTVSVGSASLIRVPHTPRHMILFMQRKEKYWPTKTNMWL